MNGYRCNISTICFASEGAGIVVRTTMSLSPMKEGIITWSFSERNTGLMEATELGELLFNHCLVSSNDRSITGEPPPCFGMIIVLSNLPKFFSRSLLSTILNHVSFILSIFPSMSEYDISISFIGSSIGAMNTALKLLEYRSVPFIISNCRPGGIIPVLVTRKNCSRRVSSKLLPRKRKYHFHLSCTVSEATMICSLPLSHCNSRFVLSLNLKLVLSKSVCQSTSFNA